ncbi:unnamed protein product [Callosobruchus maculatus]|uniref:Asteroid domain-containing protein n=1 Tax=Callosobruchus maculatus TaxID=64391 RepID=A0A653DWS6_CALMS|nr:unnamed protein product [Callosobruchus maculatus]
MGIPGLTTFIENRADLYMDNHKLHDTSLVIDGNSLACQIYQQSGSNMCFGGDYDKYGHIIMVFFEALFKCKITPYVVFDGGYESRKMKTIINRLKNRIKAVENMSGVGENSSVFSLFIWEILRDIGHKWEVKMVQCDLEADTDIANIARRLGCPVLSFDSDFYIFDGLYIPFTRLDMTVRRNIDLSTKTSYNFLYCQIYNIDKFLCSYGRIDKSNLPLLAVLLGNDYVKQSTFSMFYQNLEVHNCHGRHSSESQNRIKSVLVWLQNETRESAIRKVLGWYRKEKREKILESINNAIKGYNCFDSIYLKYLDISPSEVQSTDESINFNNLGDIEDPLEPEDDEEKQTESDADQEIIFSGDDGESTLPIIFKENFRKCLYPSSFMDMFIRHKYYCIAQVEEVTADNAYVVSFDIISAIFKILTGLSEGLTCIGRVGRLIGKMNVPAYNSPLPTLEEIENMDSTEKQKVFFKILNLDDTFKDCLSLFPYSWHIYILAIKYATDKSKLDWPLVYSLVMSKIIISCIDFKTGFIRSVAAFMKKYAAKLREPVETKDVPSSSQDVSVCLDNISTVDSIHCMDSLIHYFQKDQKVASSYKLFDRNLVHSISEFQSILLHLKYLNNLLQRPYHDFCVSDCLNCTFVYNFTANLSKRQNIENYLDILLCKAPTVLRTVYAVINAVKKSGTDSVDNANAPPRKLK